MGSESHTGADFRRIFRGSFLLSLGHSYGHDAIAILHASYARQAGLILSPENIFGTNTPAVEYLPLPTNHFMMSEADWKQQNELVWSGYLDKFFKTNPNDTKHEAHIQLIEANAKTDVKFFDNRRNGKGVSFSKTIQPSLLRYFILEGKLPSLYAEHRFYKQLIEEVSHGIISAISNSYLDTPHLLNLVNIWSEVYPNIPFIPR